MRAEDHQREELEQYLGADHCGVGGRVVLRGDLDDVAANEIEAGEAAQDRLRLARREAAGLGCPGAGGEGRSRPSTTIRTTAEQASFAPAAMR